MGMVKHGLRNSPLYYKWKGMRQRCNDVNSRNYKWYGGRGIGICKEWQDFKNFHEWCLNNGWKGGLEIDRIDRNNDYKPSNCELVTHQENIRRSSATKLTPNDILDIRNAYLLIENIKSREVAEAYGISQCHVRSIVTKKLWRDL